MPTPTIKRTPRCQSRLTTTPWRQKRHTALLVLIATLGVAVPGTAGAEDFSLRVGAGLDLEAQTQFTDRDCSSAPRTPLYGCGRGDDGAPLRSLGDFRTAASLELGLGYTAAPALRIEALVEYRPHVAFKGHTNFLAPTQLQSVSTDLSSLSGMLAAYVDLPALGLPPLGPFSPFIGGGLGAAHTRIDETRMTFPKTTTIVPGAGRTGFVWMLTAGLGLPLGERTTLDLAWRYTDYGTVETGAGSGQVIWRDGSREPLALNLAPTRAKLRSHGVRLSVRYAF